MLFIRKYLGVLLCLCALYFVKAQTKKKYDVLIVDGFSNHDWQRTTELVKQILEESELFNVSISTVPNMKDTAVWADWHPDFKQFHVVIQNTNNIHDTTLHWPKKAKLAIEEYMNSGGGLYVLHSANNAFPHWKTYNRIIGLGWRKKESGVALQVAKDKSIVRIMKGEGKDTYHGPRKDMVIKILTDHPINRQMPREWKSPNMELYKFARGPAKEVTILSYAKDGETGINWPVEWVVDYKKSRVYNSSMGHLWKGDSYPMSYRCVGFRTILIRATEWLASGKTTYAVPANFPTENKISLIKSN